MSGFLIKVVIVLAILVILTVVALVKYILFGGAC